MGTIDLTLPVAGTEITAGLHATNYQALETLLNGNLDNSNVSGSADLDAVARHGVRINSAGSTFERRRLNVIAGTGITLGLADDSGTEEIDLTITSSAATARALLSGFTYTDLPASQTNVQLLRAIVTAGGGGGFTISIPMPRAGSITGITASGNAARTNGTATFEVWKNGVATGLTCVLDGTTTQWTSATQAVGTDTFVANDRLDVRVTTNGTWAPTTMEVEAVIEVSFD